MTVKFACAFAAFCAIVHSNIVFILCISALSKNKTLKIINKHPTGLCEHCGVEESVEHVFSRTCYLCLSNVY